MTTALVNKIIPSSLVDGPGNRMAIFLQGCNIYCAYCHNPETRKVCQNCGVCVKECPFGALAMVDYKVAWNADRCTNCDHCIEVCPYDASPKVRAMTAGEVFAEVKKAMPFIRGITVSGGECTLYPKFLIELFHLAKQAQLTCLIDSNGTFDFEEQPELLDGCDGVMLDVKSWDEQMYRNLTGGSNAMVKKNLRFLAEKKKLEELRVVCLPGQVDAREVIRQTGAIVLPVNPEIRIKLIKFRNFGVKGAFSALASPSDAQMGELRRYAEESGFYNIITI